MSIITKTNRFIKCANPNCDYEFQVDHLLTGNHGTKWNWSCEDCGFENEINAILNKANQIVDLNATINTQNPRTVPIYVLLAYHKKEEHFFLVVEDKAYDHDGKGHDLDKSYYYNEHTCPTNWMGGSVIRLLDGKEGDDDPHGIFQFVAAKLKTEIDSQYGEDHNGNLPWFEVFSKEIDFHKGIIDMEISDQIKSLT